MGYVSYLEDIIERSNSILSDIRNATVPGRPGTKRVGTQVQRLELDKVLKACERIVEELMDLATNPEIELADEVRILKDEKAAQEAEIERLNSTIERGRAAIKDLRKEFDRVQTANRSKKAKIDELKLQIEALENPENVYGANFRRMR